MNDGKSKNLEVGKENKYELSRMSVFCFQLLGRYKQNPPGKRLTIQALLIVQSIICGRSYLFWKWLNTSTITHSNRGA